MNKEKLFSNKNFVGVNQIDSFCWATKSELENLKLLSSLTKEEVMTLLNIV